LTCIHPGDDLRLLLPFDPSLLDDDTAHEGLEHLGGDDVLLLDTLHVRPPAGTLEFLEPLPLGG
jgi:hypothetical protein